MEEAEQEKYREAADLVWEIAKKFHGHLVCDDLKSVATELHVRAGGHRSSMLPPIPGGKD